MCIVTPSCCGFRNCKRNPQITSEIRKLLVESAFCLRIPLKFADSTYILRIPLTYCGINLQLPNPKKLAIFSCCGLRNKTNVPTNFTLQVFVCGIHDNFVSGIHLHFGICLKICLWNPEHIDTKLCPYSVHSLAS